MPVVHGDADPGRRELRRGLGRVRAGGDVRGRLRRVGDPRRSGRSTSRLRRVRRSPTPCRTGSRSSPAQPTKKPSITTCRRCWRTRSWSTRRHRAAAPGCVGDDAAELPVPERLHELRRQYRGHRRELVVSSEATGKTGGSSAPESKAANLVAEGRMRDYPGLKTTAGAAVPLSPNEIQQLVTMNADTIDFQTAAPPLGPANNNNVMAGWPSTRPATRASRATTCTRATAASMPADRGRGGGPADPARGADQRPGLVPDVLPIADARCPRPDRGRARAVLQVGARGRGRHEPSPGSWYLLARGHGSRARQPRVRRRSRWEISSVFPAGTSFTDGRAGRAAARPIRTGSDFTLRLVVTITAA